MEYWRVHRYIKLKFAKIISSKLINYEIASWAAMNYPNVRAVMLDATFDHVLPLASNVMPSSWKPLVVSTVKNHMNLAVAEQLVRYPGPVVIFRRTRDEVISLEYKFFPRNLTKKNWN